ncbi:DUF998 domain-containing protein [Sphaerisporangium sp. NPDC051017]|uniref:DUF998 domain-containing protein n=1 Tax=Sphaerisporangium sp. NPDC051017 TaxID=3154636 RepID=UPI0034427CE0
MSAKPAIGSRSAKPATGTTINCPTGTAGRTPTVNWTPFVDPTETSDPTSITGRIRIAGPAQTAEPAVGDRLARMLARAGGLWLACGVGTAVASELGRRGGIDLIRPTFSELIFTNPGTRLVGLSMVSLAFAAVCVALALDGLRAPADRLTWTLVGGWSGTLIVAAIFPMTSAGAPPAWHDSLHRYAALAGLLCLPLAGLRLARRSKADPRRLPAMPLVRLLCVASMLGVAAFLATFVPVGHPLWLLGARQYSGVTERVALVADVALLATLMAAALRTSARSRRG